MPRAPFSTVAGESAASKSQICLAGSLKWKRIPASARIMPRMPTLQSNGERSRRHAIGRELIRGGLAENLALDALPVVLHEVVFARRAHLRTFIFVE